MEGIRWNIGLEFPTINADVTGPKKPYIMSSAPSTTCHRKVVFFSQHFFQQSHCGENKTLFTQIYAFRVCCGKELLLSELRCCCSACCILPVVWFLAFDLKDRHKEDCLMLHMNESRQVHMIGKITETTCNKPVVNTLVKFCWGCQVLIQLDVHFWSCCTLNCQSNILTPFSLFLFTHCIHL